MNFSPNTKHIQHPLFLWKGLYNVRTDICMSRFKSPLSYFRIAVWNDGFSIRCLSNICRRCVVHSQEHSQCTRTWKTPILCMHYRQFQFPAIHRPALNINPNWQNETFETLPRLVNCEFSFQRMMTFEHWGINDLYDTAQNNIRIAYFFNLLGIDAVTSIILF